jgi:hypothetical protein
MSSLQARVEKQFQLSIKILDPSAIMMRNTRTSDNLDLPIKIKHGKEDRSSFKLYPQKKGLKEKVKHIEKGS